MRRHPLNSSETLLELPRLPPLEMASGADAPKRPVEWGGSSVLVRPLRSNMRAQGVVARQQVVCTLFFFPEVRWTTRRNASSSARPSRRRNGVLHRVTRPLDNKPPASAHVAWWRDAATDAARA
ncbi:hypothetical protein ACCO45_010472 [Purpureocillium lilacinum]|uniref:Uncharacterized protein n=1 Tax=Purpureocillium lilacinum TaxID=33203 RepID=A0ACC4DGE0_PURLI